MSPERIPSAAVRYAGAVFSPAIATVVGLAALERRDLTDVVMLYLLGIVIVATRLGFGASIACGVLSVLAFDFVFTEPYFTFTVTDPRHVLTFVVMLVVGVVIATLTQRVRDQVESARESERRTSRLYAMSRVLARTQGFDELLRAAESHLAEAFGCEVLAMGATEQGVVDVRAPAEREIVAWVAEHRRPAGRGTDTVASRRGSYFPLVGSGTTTLGVLAVFVPSDDPELHRLAESLATQIATALERARLGEEASRVRLQLEAESLRSTLLSSVSHDLRTPLAVVRGAASTLVDDHDDLTDSARRELASAVLEETERLDRQVRNLLDMTRLESGAVKAKKEWVPIQEIIGAAYNRLEARLSSRDVRFDVPGDVFSNLDPVLVEQLFVNLLENVGKHTAEGTPIEVRARSEDTVVVVELADHGPGVAEKERASVFEKFYRGTTGASQGVGLGLAICRAIATVHDGTIDVFAREGGGARFVLKLPIGEAPPDLVLEESSS